MNKSYIYSAIGEQPMHPRGSIDYTQVTFADVLTILNNNLNASFRNLIAKENA